MRSPLKWPSTRGARNALVITPSNSPHPPTSTAPGVGAERVHDAGEEAVALVPVGAGDVEGDPGVLPQAVRPWNSTYVLRVAKRLGPISTHSGSSL